MPLGHERLLVEKYYTHKIYCKLIHKWWVLCTVRDFQMEDFYIDQSNIAVADEIESTTEISNISHHPCAARQNVPKCRAHVCHDARPSASFRQALAWVLLYRITNIPATSSHDASWRTVQRHMHFRTNHPFNHLYHTVNTCQILPSLHFIPQFAPNSVPTAITTLPPPLIHPTSRSTTAPRQHAHLLPDRTPCPRPASRRPRECPAGSRSLPTTLRPLRFRSVRARPFSWSARRVERGLQ